MVSLLKTSQFGADIVDGCVRQKIGRAHCVLIRRNPQNWRVKINITQLGTVDTVEKNIVTCYLGPLRQDAVLVTNIDTDWYRKNNVLVFVKGIEMICIEIMYCV